jgi:RHS repeat-associated protein
VASGSTPYGELRYKAFGETRYTWGTTPTAYKFTGQRLDDATGLYYYGARYYDPALGRFVQADTIVPEPGNPQALNRYSYVLNNPLRYHDPSGHDAEDVRDFLEGFVAQWAYNNAWMSPQAQEALAAQPNESTAMTAGRVLGDIITMAQGVAEVTIGGGMTGGGAAACGTGVLCVAGAPAMAAGVTTMAHGATTGLVGATQFGRNTANLIMMARRGPAIPAIKPPTDRGGLRKAMEKAGIKPPPGMKSPQAHHDLPWRFKDWFAAERRGLNVNDPQFGRWVEGTPPGQHQVWTRAYEDAWTEWILKNQNATRQQVLDFLNQLLPSGSYP